MRRHTMTIHLNEEKAKEFNVDIEAVKKRVDAWFALEIVRKTLDDGSMVFTNPPEQHIYSSQFGGPMAELVDDEEFMKICDKFTWIDDDDDDGRYEMDILEDVRNGDFDFDEE